MTSNGKILIVDDDADLRQALRLRLRANHYETVNACDGYSAIAQAYKEHPNLIILDLGLPAGNGFVVLDRLQKDDKRSTIPVIVLTARDAQSSEEMALRSGAAAFFQKPADNADLLSVIRATLSHAEGSTSLPS